MMRPTTEAAVMAQEEAEEAVAVEVAARYFRHTSQTRCQIPL